MAIFTTTTNGHKGPTMERCTKDPQAKIDITRRSERDDNTQQQFRRARSQLLIPLLITSAARAGIHSITLHFIIVVVIFIADQIMQMTPPVLNKICLLSATFFTSSNNEKLPR